jgi:hypothetical protein
VEIEILLLLVEQVVLAVAVEVKTVIHQLMQAVLEIRLLFLLHRETMAVLVKKAEAILLVEVAEVLVLLVELPLLQKQAELEEQAQQVQLQVQALPMQVAEVVVGI